MNKLNLLCIIVLISIFMSMFVSAEDGIACYTFDEDTDGYLNDSGNQGNDYDFEGTIDSYTISVSPALKEATKYDGSTNLVQVNITNSEDIRTFALWVKPVTFISNGGPLAIHGDVSGSYNRLTLFFGNADSSLYIHYSIGGSTLVDIDTGIDLIQNEWQHLVVTLGSGVTIYLNGTPLYNFTDNTVLPSGWNLSVGKYFSWYFEGEIDNLVLSSKRYNRDDVDLSYNNHVGVSCLAVDTTPPTNSTWNVTSKNLPTGENSSIWNAGGQYVINITNNTLSLTVTTDENSNGSCAIGKNWNYTTMVADNINYKFATTEVTEHAYLIYDDIPIGNNCLYCSFIDASGNEFANSSSGCLSISRVSAIKGYVFDSLSNIIVGARVYITNLFTNITEVAVTNASGIYETINVYEKGIHMISGGDINNYTLKPDAQWVNVT